jgi:phospholipase/lecithinase/hemolysin
MAPDHQLVGMRFFCHKLPGIAGAAVALWATVAWGGSPIERFYVFGDSYSDGGNGYSMIRQPSGPPYQARYSNGPTAVEYLAQTLGTPLRNASESGLPEESSINFAVSGAWTSRKNNDAPMDGKTGLLSQVADFARLVSSGKARFAPQTSLFFIGIGANDALFGTIGGIDAARLISEAVQNLEKAVRSLHGSGARHIAIGTVPNIGTTPRAAALSPDRLAAVNAVVAGINLGYLRQASALRASLNADVFVVPWGAYYDSIAAAPKAYGLATAASCIGRDAGDPRSVCPKPEQHVFLDQLHPTTATQALVARRLATQSWPHFVCPDQSGGRPAARRELMSSVEGNLAQ